MLSSLLSPAALVDSTAAWPPSSVLHARPTRIVHVTDFYLPRLGGIERHVSDLAAAQRSVGYEVDVVSVGGRVDVGGSPFRPSDRPATSLASWSPSEIRAAGKAALNGEYDVVHVHASLGTPLAFSVASVASRAGLPTVVTMHSLLGGTGPLFRVADPVVGWRRWPVEWTAVSRTAADDLRRWLPGDRTVTVLNNAIDVDRWRGDRPEPHDDVHIVAVMRLARRKRPLQLLAMLRSVRAVVPSDVWLRATIIGEGPSRAAMERYLAHHDLGSWVKLAGRRDHDCIRAIYRTADVFVAPAIQESFGIAALEARAAGLPIVAMERSGIAEFIEHRRSGLLVSSDHSMVEAICQLVVDAPLRSAIANHNVLFPPPFGWGGAVHAAAQVYETAASHQMVRSTTLRRRSDLQVGAA